MEITKTTRRQHLSMARRAISMALSQEEGWEKACSEWITTFDLIAIENALDLVDGRDNRFCLVSDHKEED